jgi:hypothetical protein
VTELREFEHTIQGKKFRVVCNGLECGPCGFAYSAYADHCGLFTGALYRKKFWDPDSGLDRCQACLDAEKEAKRDG